MISKHGFIKGELVEFQDYRRCWVRGTVALYEPTEVMQQGPGGTIVERTPAKVHVIVNNSMGRKPRVVILNPKRVRALKT